MANFGSLLLCSIVYVTVVAAIGSFAAASSWETWHQALPNTQMPKSLLEILQPSDKQFSYDPKDYIGVGKTALNINDNKNQKGQGSVFPAAGKDSYSTGPNQGPNEPIKIPADVTTFFLQKDLNSGTKMTLLFPKTTAPSPNFLPRHVTDTIPFSSKKLPEILRRFSVDPASEAAAIMKETIEDCEAPGVRGEDKRCATSLQSLVGFGVSRLGRDVDVFETDAGLESGEKKGYSVGASKVIGERSVVCHRKNYVYAVFYCHAIHATRAYVVDLVGEDGGGGDGARGTAVAVCHLDTKNWSPELLVFKVLKVKPGTVPVCHFLPADNLVWVPKQKI